MKLTLDTKEVKAAVEAYVKCRLNEADDIKVSDVLFIGVSYSGDIVFPTATVTVELTNDNKES